MHFGPTFVDALALAGVNTGCMLNAAKNRSEAYSEVTHNQGGRTFSQIVNTKHGQDDSLTNKSL
jgi:hypothetical protein